MINLTSGLTNSVWLSVKEMLPIGLTAPSYQLELTRDINGEISTFTPADLATSGAWSRFDIKPTLEAGNYSYKVSEITTSTILETGRAQVYEGPKVFPVRPNIPKKDNVRVYKK